MIFFVQIPKIQIDRPKFRTCLALPSCFQAGLAKLGRFGRSIWIFRFGYNFGFLISRHWIIQYEYDQLAEQIGVCVCKRGYLMVVGSIWGKQCGSSQTYYDLKLHFFHFCPFSILIYWHCVDFFKKSSIYFFTSKFFQNWKFYGNKEKWD